MDIPAIDPDEFEYVNGYFSERVDVEAIRKNGLGKDAIPLLIEPLKERYKEPKRRGEFIMRWMALRGLIWSGRLSPKYYRAAEGSEHEWVSPSAVRLAANFPVGDGFKFDAERFLKSLQEEES